MKQWFLCPACGRTFETDIGQTEPLPPGITHPLCANCDPATVVVNAAMRWNSAKMLVSNHLARLEAGEDEKLSALGLANAMVLLVGQR